jgi:hypothetical protein
MKTTFIVLATIFLSAAASAQTASTTSGEVRPIQIMGHPSFAGQGQMGTERSLFGGGSISYAQGERPLWEFGEVKPEVPLGDVARAVRNEKLTAKKSAIVFEKQGRH